MGNWKKHSNFFNLRITASSSYCFCKIIGSASFPFQPVTQQHRGSELHGFTEDSALRKLPFLPPSFPPFLYSPSKDAPESEVKAIIAAAQEEAAQKRSLHHQLSEDSGAEVIPAITQVIRLLNWALLNYLSNQYGSQDDVQRDRPLLVLASQWVQSDWIQ